MMEPIVSEEHDFFAEYLTEGELDDVGDYEEEEEEDSFIGGGEEGKENGVENTEDIIASTSALLDDFDISTFLADDDNEEKATKSKEEDKGKTEPPTTSKNDPPSADLNVVSSSSPSTDMPTTLTPPTTPPPSSSYFSIDRDEKNSKKPSPLSSPTVATASPTMLPNTVSASPTQQQPVVECAKTTSTTEMLLMQHQMHELQKQNKALQERNHALQVENEMLQKENDVLISEQDVWTEESLTTSNSSTVARETNATTTTSTKKKIMSSLENAERDELLKTIEHLKDRIIDLVEEKLEMQTTIDSLEHQFVDVELDDNDKNDSNKRGRLMNLFHQNSPTNTKDIMGTASEEIPAIDENTSQGDMIQAALVKKRQSSTMRGSIFSKTAGGSGLPDFEFEAGKKIDLDIYKKLAENEEADEEEKRIKAEARRIRSGLPLSPSGERSLSKQQQELLKQDAASAGSGLLAPSAITPTSSYIDDDQIEPFDRQSWKELNNDLVTEEMVVSMVGSDSYQAKFVQSVLEKKQQQQNAPKRNNRGWGLGKILSKKNATSESPKSETSTNKGKVSRSTSKEQLSAAAIVDTKPRPLLMDVDKLNDRDSTSSPVSNNKNNKLLMPSLGGITQSLSSPHSPRSLPPKDAFKATDCSTSKLYDKTSGESSNTSVGAAAATSVTGDNIKENPAFRGGEQPIEQSKLLDYYITKKKQKSSSSSSSLLSRVFSSSIRRNNGSVDQKDEMVQLEEEVLRRQMARKRREDERMRHQNGGENDGEEGNNNGAGKIQLDSEDKPKIHATRLSGML